MSTQEQQTEYDPIIEGPLNFCEQFAEILGENFLVEDMVWQEDLFEIQDKLARLICAAANSNSSYVRRIAKPFIDNNPACFKTSEE